MKILATEDGGGVVARLDPRGRIIAVFALAVFFVLLNRWSAMGLGLLVVLALAVLARCLNRDTLRRLIALNLFVLFLLVFTPFSMPGTPLLHLGGMSWSREGLLFSLRIGLKANTVMLLCNALLSSVEPADLAHALHRLRLPAKLIHTLFFCVRYLEVLHVEYHRLRNAMRLRAFEPRCSRHALRSLGYLLGMLFVRSCDRSDRILEAMKCRGFAGRLYSLSQFHAGARDVVFGLGMVAVVAVTGYLEWMS